MASIVFKANRAGIRDLLSMEGVQKDLLRRAQRVAAAARPGYRAESSAIRVVADVELGKVRAHASVAAIGIGALTIEQERRVLGGAIDAARG